MTTTAVIGTPVETPDLGPVRPGRALFAALFGSALVTLDASVVNVALPAIGGDLGGGMAGLQWVVDAYTLVFAALMLSTGALADRIGAVRAYALGAGVFTAASMACGLAPGMGTLIGARVVQGMAAAVMLPASLALVREAYADPERRARAVALWAAGGSVALALGPVVGGVLTSALSWRGIFFVNLPLGLAVLLLLAKAAPSVRRPAPLDLPGQVTAVIALAGAAFAVIEGGTAGLVAGAVAVVAFLAFLRAESRHPHPVVPLAVFRIPAVSVSVVGGAAISAAFYGLVFVYGLYFQRILGLDVLWAGLAFLPMSGLIAVMNVVSGRLTTRYGARTPMLIGQPLAAAGLIPLAVWTGATTPPLCAALLLVPFALGCGLTIPALTAAMMEAVPAERAGTAAGVLNAARQTAGGLGIAVFGSLVADGFIAGTTTSVIVSAALMTLSAAATLLWGPRGRQA